MRISFCVLLALLATVAVGCHSAPSESSDVPAQTYTSKLNLLGKSNGSIIGRVVFPSEFTQRSTTFFVGQVKFATLPDGRFRITTVPTGQHEVRVFAPGFEPAMVPVNVTNGGEAAMKPIQLRAARGKVIGRLVDEQGKSAAGIAVHLAPFGSATTTDQDGIFTFLGVGPGEVLLGVNDPYFTPQPQRFTLARDEARNLGNVRVGRAQIGGTGRTAELPPGSERPR